MEHSKSNKFGEIGNCAHRDDQKGAQEAPRVDLGGHFGRLFEFNCTVLDHKWCQRGGTWEDQERIGKQEGKSKEEAEQEGKREEQGSEKGEHGRKRKEAGKKQRRTEKEPAEVCNDKGKT